MVIATPPPPVPVPPQKKRKGLGCLGCGCLVLVLLAALFIGLISLVGYLGYSKALALTASAPSTIQTFDGGDEMYNAARQKITDFKHDLNDHVAAKIELNGDEINTLLAREPNLAGNNIHLFVSMKNDEARVQGSVLLDHYFYNLFKGRYLNFDLSATIDFDPQSKSINFTPLSLAFADKVILSPDTDDSDTSSKAATDRAFIQAFIPSFNQSFNESFRKTPDGMALLNQAKSISIKDGELVIEIQ